MCTCRVLREGMLCFEGAALRPGLRGWCRRDHVARTVGTRTQKVHWVDTDQPSFTRNKLQKGGGLGGFSQGSPNQI